jgi:hypothetical protein
MLHGKTTNSLDESFVVTILPSNNIVGPSITHIHTIAQQIQKKKKILRGVSNKTDGMQRTSLS